MFGQMFHDSPLLAFPIIGLALFVMSFTVVVLRTLSRSAEDFRLVAELPLDEGARHGE